MVYKFYSWRKGVREPESGIVAAFEWSEVINRFYREFLF